MKRRDWMAAAGSLAAAAALPGPAGAHGGGGGAGAAVPPDGLETEVVRLHLRHTWTTTMSSSEHRDTLHVRLTRDGRFLADTVLIDFL